MGKPTKLDEYILRLKSDISERKERVESDSWYLKGLEHGLLLAESMQRERKEVLQLKSKVKSDQ